MPGSTNKRDVALLDVDNTLLFGTTQNLSYNDNLLKVLLEAGVRDVYLFTSMTVDSEGVKERQVLVNYMETKGFTVHGVITPSDIFWQLEQDLMTSFLSHFKRPDNSLTKSLLAQEQYRVINFKIESQPGIAFATALNNPERMAEYASRSSAANGVLGLVKRSEDQYASEKGHMYDLFAKHKPEWVNRIVFADDAPDNISAVEKANEKYNFSLVTVLNRDEQKNCEAFPTSFYQDSLASLINTHKLKQVVSLYKESRGENHQSSLLSWVPFFKKTATPGQEDAAMSALEQVLDNEKTDLLPHLAILRQGELGSAIRRFVKSGAANALCGKKVSSVSEFVNALHSQVNGQNTFALEL